MVAAAADKVCVLAIFKCDGKVYALPAADATSQTLLRALKTRLKGDFVVYTDGFSSYDILMCRASRAVGSTTARPSSTGVVITSTRSRISGTNPSGRFAIQRHPTQEFLPALEGMQVPVQLPGTKTAACHPTPVAGSITVI